ncbi:MAG TPA: hypothetical protein VH063_08840 [Gaiellaceae bacterium]|jgi:hypothetical protein|nr:hypothetical protein [Gaiellaceae bacterium]
MTKAGTFLTAAIAAGVLAAAASAGPAVKVVTLQTGQTMELSGSHVLCIYQKRDGGAGIECAVGDSSGQPLHDSYIVVMPTTGGISVVVPYSNKVVFVRKGGVLQRASAIVVGPGVEIKLAGTTKLGCSTVAVRGVPTVFCDLLDAHGNFLPNSYAFGLGDTTLTALHWNPAGKVSTVKSWRENG